MNQGTKVTTVVDGSIGVFKIVGKATTDITQTMIIECLNGVIPNETYPYTHCVMPLALLTVLKD